MSNMPQYRIADLTLDLAQGRLIGKTGPVLLRRKSFELLCFMARNAGRVLPKEDLMSAVWPDVTVTDDSLTQCIRDVRRALGPAGADVLQTVPRRGYILMQAAAVSATAALLPATAELLPPLAQTSPPHGSIAIMPFTMPTPCSATEQLQADGLVNDIISRMAQLRSFHMIARASTFALPHLTADPQAIRARLGAEYAVTGSLSRRRDQMILHLDLLRTDDGTILWTEVIPFRWADILDLINDLTDQIVSALSRQIALAERQRALLVPEQALDAWECYHLGISHAFRFNAGQMALAQGYFERATRLDPGFARAHAGLSFCHYFFAFSGTAPNRDAALHMAMVTAEQAMLADEGNPTAQWSYGRALWLNGKSDAGLHHVLRAVDLSPSFAHARYMAGFVEAYHGDPDRAVAHLAKSESLSPIDPFRSSIHITRAHALLALGQTEPAAFWARKVAGDATAYAQMLATAAVILAAAGHVTEARCLAQTLRRAHPTYDSRTMFRSLYDLPPAIQATYAKAASDIGL